MPLKFTLALFALADLACALSVGLENPKNAVRAEWKRLCPNDPGWHGARCDAAGEPAAPAAC